MPTAPQAGQACAKTEAGIVAISGLECVARRDGGRGPLLCPGAQPGSAPDRRSPIAQRRLVARFLATVRFIGFFFAFALVFIFVAVLAIVCPLSSLSRSNQFEQENTEQIHRTC